MSWNVNGLGGGRLDEFVNTLRSLNFPSIVCIQETHSKNYETITGWKNELSAYNCFFNHGDGRNRGTGILIHKNLSFKLLMEIQDWEEGRFTILKGKIFNHLVTIASIYAPIPNSDKPWFFERIFACNLEGIKFLMGDFNAVLDPKLDRLRCTSPVKSFQEFLEFTDTIDVWRRLNPARRCYTYGGTSRIDYILISDSLSDHIERVTIEPQFFSDHRIVAAKFSFGESTIGKDFYKIRPNTIASKDYDQVFQSVWNRSLQYFRNEILQKINAGTFVGDLQEAIDSTGSAIEYTHDIILSNLTLGPDWWDYFKSEILEASLEFQRKNISEKQKQFNKLQREFYRLPEGSPSKDNIGKQLHSLLKEITKEFNFQKAKDKRMTHERYSAAFFKQAGKDRKAESLTKLRGFNGEILTDRTEIQDHLLLQYFHLYQSEPMQQGNLDIFKKYVPKLKSKEDIRPFTYAEALLAFQGMASGTCPGPDGIPCDFYKKYFNVFGHFYVRMLNKCIKEKIIPKSWELSILKVIPKIPGEIPSFDTLRPLTLGNVDCKHEASMLCKRMVKVADKVIHNLQTGGLPSRKIQESTFLIHLIINLYKENNWGGYIVALDNYKAFDKLKRDFMWIVLKEMGFDQWTIQAIQNLYRETSACINVCGFLTEPFSIESGVKQGCPLSALLFAITMEPLARAILEEPKFKNFGFRIPGNKEVRLIQHLDDMTLFATNVHAVRAFMKKVIQYNPLSGASINYGKSFIIRLDRQSQILNLDGPKLCDIRVLENGECKKILGIYFGSQIEVYIEDNWLAVYKKCLESLKLWKICFSSNGFTSLMGRALVVHVKIHSKILYLMQTMQFYSDTIDKINQAVHSFLWAGKKHIPTINLSVLEAPMKLGGIGIKPLDHRAISLRFNHIKNFFVREGDHWIVEKSPAEAIICYYLNFSVRSLVPNVPRTTIIPLNLLSKYHKPGPIRYIGHLPNIFDILYWDIERAISVIESPEFFENYSSKAYLEDLMERRTLKLRQGTIKKAFISKFHFPLHVEKAIWDNVSLKLLEPKLKAFAYKIAHDCLPTKYAMWRIMRNFARNQYNPWCQFCRLVLLTNTVSTAKHIFMYCPVARNTWNNINGILRAAGESEYRVSEEFIFFRLGLDKNHAYFIIEILWALWRVSNYNNYEVRDDQTARLWTQNDAIKIIKNRTRYISTIDKGIHGNRAYKKRWDGINKIVRFVFDNG